LIININKISFLNKYKTLLISLLLTLLIAPIYWLVSEDNIEWVIAAITITFIGNYLTFYHFIHNVYPHMLTEIGTILLTFILSIVSVWLNITLINVLMPIDYIYNTFLTANIPIVLFFSIGYLVIVNLITLPLLHADMQTKKMF